MKIETDRVEILAGVRGRNHRISGVFVYSKRRL